MIQRTVPGRFGVNTSGMYTLLAKEVRRFLRVPGQTVFSPLVSTSLYFLVFGYTLQGRIQTIQGVRYLEFLVPGLVFLSLANNAFLNTSSSIFITKLQGTIVDLLVAPLGPTELLIGFTGGGVVRGLAVGLLTWAVAILFVGVRVAHPLLTAATLLLTCYVFSVLGLLAGLWADKFEQVNLFPTFVMLPMTFLGGVFYSVDGLPEPWRAISRANPIVYLVETLRFAMLDTSAEPPAVGIALLVALASASTLVAWVAFRRGYKLRT